MDEEETQYEWSQKYAWYPRYEKDEEVERLWDDFGASVMDGCDDD